jgi:hypothetical protein
LNRRYQRTATTITSAGNRNPANPDFGGNQGRGRVDDFTAQACLDLANAQRNGAADRLLPGIDTSLHGLRAIIVVRAELIRDTCGYAVPFMTYDEDRDLHAKRFAREDDESLNTELFST